MNEREGRLRLGLVLTVVATAVRVAWAARVPTIPVGDFAMYRESANYLIENGGLDGGFIYMPGFVLALAAMQALGGEVASAKMLGAVLGGLAAGALFVVTACLCDGAGARQERAEAPAPARGARPLLEAAARAVRATPAAFAATSLYALWPAGVGLASVVGTDVPAAALMLGALAALVGWGPRRPRTAAAVFGLGMGLAAYVRAVALPLALLSAGYWLAGRARVRAVAARTALSVAVTLLVLSPWAIRNLRAEGALSFTDHHGGITALMGNYPNTEGTYARSLNLMFKELTGRTFLSPPHAETDREAAAIAKTWLRFDWGWTAGMTALRLERLFAAEHGLLYWSLYRPGVLPPRAAVWFNQHRAVICGVADIFYVVFVGLIAAGVAFVVAERRWAALLPLACALALAATYAVFVAEPRYRVTTEVLSFPLAGLGAQRLLAGVVRFVRRHLTAASDAIEDRDTPAAFRRGLALFALAMGLVVAASVVVVRGGAVLRARHRWAVSLWHVDGTPRLAYWRATSRPSGTSPVRGTPDAVALRLLPAETEGRATADVVVAGAAPRLRATLVWSSATDPAARLHIGALVAGPDAAVLEGDVAASGAVATRLAVELRAPAGTRADVIIRDVVLSSR